MSFSSSSSVRIEGLKELDTFIKNLNPKLSKVFQTISGKYAQSMYSEMTQRVPVRTGYLKSTIGSSSSPNQIELYVTADYAGYVNYGTRRMKARPFFSAVVQGQVPKFLQELSDEVTKALK